MLKALLAWLFGGRKRAEPPVAERRPVTASAATVTRRAAPVVGAVLLCRETVLGRDRRVVGYHFRLQAQRTPESMDRATAHAWAQALVERLAALDLPQILGKRMAFVDVPDSFISDPALQRLPAGNTVLMPVAHGDVGAPAASALRENLQALQRQGYRIALPDPVSAPHFSAHLSLADAVVLRAAALDVKRGLQLSSLIAHAAPRASLLVRDLPSLEEFRFSYKMGAALFQGPFITSREDWSERNLGPNTQRIANIIGRLRAGAEIRELAELLKQDGALSLRLLRYINAAANGLQEQVSSIERALTLLGREPLYRWLALLVCSSDGESGQAGAMESALVRARTMETLASERPQAMRDALFLTGLLSLMDVVLQVPLEKALAPLALAPEITEAIREQDGPYAPMLALAIACERADVEAIEAACVRCNVSAEDATACHMAALSWAIGIQGGSA